MFPGFLRTSKQCREKWNYQLCPSARKGVSVAAQSPVAHHLPVVHRLPRSSHPLLPIYLFQTPHSASSLQQRVRLQQQSRITWPTLLLRIAHPSHALWPAWSRSWLWGGQLSLSALIALVRTSVAPDTRQAWNGLRRMPGYSPPPYDSIANPCACSTRARLGRRQRSSFWSTRTRSRAIAGARSAACCRTAPRRTSKTTCVFMCVVAAGSSYARVCVCACRCMCVSSCMHGCL